MYIVMHKNKERKVNNNPTDNNVNTVIRSLWFDRGTVCNVTVVCIVDYCCLTSYFRLIVE
jgi:hypothetical protein